MDPWQEFVAWFVGLPWKAAGSSALLTFATAARQDKESFRAWRDRGEPFNWRLAIRRWFIGAGIGFFGVMLGGKLGPILVSIFGV